MGSIYVEKYFSENFIKATLYLPFSDREWNRAGRVCEPQQCGAQDKENSAEHSQQKVCWGENRIKIQGV